MLNYRIVKLLHITSTVFINTMHIIYIYIYIYIRLRVIMLFKYHSYYNYLNYYNYENYDKVKITDLILLK